MRLTVLTVRKRLHAQEAAILLLSLEQVRYDKPKIRLPPNVCFDRERSLMPTTGLGGRYVFDSTCSCITPECEHVALEAASTDRRTSLRSARGSWKLRT